MSFIFVGFFSRFTSVELQKAGIFTKGILYYAILVTFDMLFDSGGSGPKKASSKDDNNTFSIGLIIGLTCAALLLLIGLIYACVTCARMRKDKKAKMVIDQERGAKLKGNMSYREELGRSQSGAFTNTHFIKLEEDNQSSLPRYVGKEHIV